MEKDAKKKKRASGSPMPEKVTPKKSPGKIKRKKSPNFGPSSDFIQLQTAGTDEEPKSNDEIVDSEEIVANDIVKKRKKSCSTENAQSAKKISTDQVEEKETDDEMVNSEEVMANDIIKKRKKSCSTENAQSDEKISTDQVEEKETDDEMVDSEEVVANDIVKKRKKSGSTENAQSDKKISTDQVEKKETDKYKLFIGKFSTNTTQEELEQHFKQSVDFVSIQFPVFQSTKKPRGYAFIQLASKEDYKVALTLNGSVLKGKQIIVESIQAKRKISDEKASNKISDVPNKKSKKSNPKEDEIENIQVGSEKKSKYSLFIGMLPFDTTKEELEEHVKKSNLNFKSIRMPAYESTNKPRGFAFIDFTSEEDYKAAMALDKSVLKGRQISVEYTCAGSKKSKKRSAKIKAKTLKFKGLQEIGIMPKSKVDIRW